MAENTAICYCQQETVPKKATAAEVVEIIVPNSGSSITAAWLIAKANLNRLRRQPSMQRVPDLLRRNKKHAEMFDPAVVAIGPYHRSKPHLSAMEDRKKEAAIAFAEPNAEAFYNKVLEIVRECRDCYYVDNNDPPPAMSDEELSLMLFFDGCFILQFIDQLVKSDLRGFTVSAHLHGFILRDMFLLENQLPYLLLEKLMGVKSVEIDKFLDRVAGTDGQWQEEKNESSSKGIEWPHQHLLARLRMRQLGPKDEMARLAWGSGWQSFRSVKELIESGIKLRRGKTFFLRDVKFTPHLVCGELSLPQIVIDDLTRSRLMNMIALEMCSTAGGDYGITSFVWFLDLLIDHADDVKELRQAGVLLNALGSDEQVAEMFNEIATDLAPDQQAYSGVMNAITTYYGNTVRVWACRMLHMHFGSLWGIAFLTAVVLLVLTVVQTVFTVLQTIYSMPQPPPPAH